VGDLLDDRRKGLEEEYFHRKNKEAIEKMREKMRIAAEAKSAATSSLQCPRCDGKLKTTTFENVAIDVCEKCGGVWLDSGELELLTRSDSSSWLARLWNSWNSE
jgi:hypothetical protein